MSPGYRFAHPGYTINVSNFSGSGNAHPAEMPAAARGGGAARVLGGRHYRALAQVRMKPSISLSAQASVLSIGSPCMNRTTILVWIAWV